MDLQHSFSAFRGELGENADTVSCRHGIKSKSGFCKTWVSKCSPQGCRSDATPRESFVTVATAI